MIAQGLNRDRVPSPRGGEWGPSAINGGRSRASGILYNEAYIGKLVYNRTRFFKDPETGRRISRSLPESEWVITSLDSLRIISDDLWKAVQSAQVPLSQHAIEQAHTPAASVLRTDQVRGMRLELHHQRRQPP